MLPKYPAQRHDGAVGEIELTANIAAALAILPDDLSLYFDTRAFSGAAQFPQRALASSKQASKIS